MTEQISKVDNGFKLTIPTILRNSCSITKGSYVKWLINDDGSILLKLVEIVEKWL